MDRIERDKKTILKMVEVYCDENHKLVQCPCSDCEELLLYSYNKLDMCRYGNDKPVCTKCETHCYQREMRARVREVMRYSGKKMLFRSPYLALRHLFDLMKFNLVLF